MVLLCYSAKNILGLSLCQIQKPTKPFPLLIRRAIFTLKPHFIYFSLSENYIPLFSIDPSFRGREVKMSKGKYERAVLQFRFGGWVQISSFFKRVFAVSFLVLLTLVSFSIFLSLIILTLFCQLNRCKPPGSDNLLRNYMIYMIHTYI